MKSIKEGIKSNTLKKVEENFASKKMDAKLMNLIKDLKISDKEASKNISSLEDTLKELDNCKNCPGLASCKNHIKGYVFYPGNKESKLVFEYIACKKLKKEEKDVLEKDASYELKNARIKDIDVTDGNRKELIKWINDFYHNYNKAKENKGLYLHGSFGCGKTFLLSALLNELKIKKNVSFEIVYFPELLRTLRDDFSSLDSKVNYYSHVEILLLDDIGAEKVTDWSRDEILGSILQERMNAHLTTFFTSNLNIDELEKHLSLSKDSIDKVKARRIIERIKQLTVDLEIISENKRH